MEPVAWPPLWDQDCHQSDADQSPWSVGVTPSDYRHWRKRTAAAPLDLGRPKAAARPRPLRPQALLMMANLPRSPGHQACQPTVYAFTGDTVACGLLRAVVATQFRPPHHHRWCPARRDRGCFFCGRANLPGLAWDLVIKTHDCWRSAGLAGSLQISRHYFLDHWRCPGKPGR